MSSAQTLTPQQRHIVLRAYTEVVLEATERGIKGPNAAKAILNAAAKVATRLTGIALRPEDVDTIVHP